MALTIQSEPNLLNALYQPIVYEYAFQRSYPSERATVAGAELLNFSGTPYTGSLQIGLQGIPSAALNLSIGSYYYLVNQPANILASVDAIVLIDILEEVTEGGYGPLAIFDFPATGVPPNFDTQPIDIFSLAAWQSLEPSFTLHVNNQVVGDVFGITVGGIISVQINTELEIQFTPLPPPQYGDNPEWYRMFRVDTEENGIVTRGNEFHVVKATQSPSIPTCTNTAPDYQFDLTTLRCTYSSPRQSSEREARQKDLNPNSPTFDQYRDSGTYFFYDNNTTACPVTYLSREYAQLFQRNNCPAGTGGAEVAYYVPVGQFTSTISQADADNQAIAYAQANGQAFANANGSCELPFVGVRYANAFFYYPDENGSYTQIVDVYLDMTVNEQPFAFTGTINLDLYEGTDITPTTEALSNQSSKMIRQQFIVEDKQVDSEGNEISFTQTFFIPRPGIGYQI